MRELYRHGPLTLREISEYLGWSLGKTRYQVDQQIGRGYLVLKRDGRVNRIDLSPMTKPEYDHSGAEFDTYWVRPGRLLAGELPGYNVEGLENDMLLSRLRWLLDSGITFFINMSSQRFDELDEYESDLMTLASERKKDIKYVRIRTPLWQLPRARAIRSILDLIDQALEQGHVIYVHDDHRQVTEVVLGCYIVRHGLQGSDAIRELERVRQGSHDGWRRAPAKENARRLVRRWVDYINIDRHGKVGDST